MDYTVRVGIRKGKRPAKNLYEIEYRYADDDGKTVQHLGDYLPTCPDCGVGVLQWAEAGYVSWHRICPDCGSHWDLHPVQVYLRRHVKLWFADIANAARDYPDGPGREVAQRLCSQEAVDLGLVSKAIDMVSDVQFAVPVLYGCWAQRARFY